MYVDGKIRAEKIRSPLISHTHTSLSPWRPQHMALQAPRNLRQPINFIPLFITCLHRCSKHGPTTKPILIKPPIFLVADVIILLTCANDYLYAYGIAKLFISTSTLIIVT